jgi:hypothetical protein
MLPSPPPRLAILIDAENVAHTCWPAALAIAGRFGTPTIVRAYVCHAPSPGWVAADGVEIIDGRPADTPNAADFLMAMDAAAMAAGRVVDDFVLVTGDDGFAAVAHGLKQRGARVYALIPFTGGAVPRRLPCVADLAVLVPQPAPVVKIEGAKPVPMKQGWPDALRLALERCLPDEEGWVELSDLGSELKKARVKPPRGKLTEAIRRTEGFELQKEDGDFLVRATGRSEPRGEPFETVEDYLRFQDEIPF